MKTVTISESVALDQPAADVWKYIEDYANDMHWRSGLIALTPDPPGPAAVGTNVHQVVKKLGSTHTMRSTVTEAGPGYCYSFDGVADTGRIDGSRTVTPDGTGKAVFTFAITMHLTGIQAMISPLIARIMTRGLRNDLSTLAAVIEVTAVGAPY